METLIYKSSIAVHVLCGILSLAAGLVAMIANKGGKVHNRAGIVFYWSMCLIFITTIIFIILYPTNLKYQFFLGVGIISFYPNWSGKRMLAMKKGSDSRTVQPTLLDKFAAWAVGFSGVCMLVYGIYLSQNPAKGYGSIYILFFVFSFISLSNAYGDLKYYLGYVESEKMHWFFAHAGKMIGAYSAAITAFCVNIVPKFLPENTPGFVHLLTWVGPGFVIGYLAGKLMKKYRTKFKIAEKPSLSAKINQLFSKKQLI